jgi:hypothetical protein
MGELGSAARRPEVADCPIERVKPSALGRKFDDRRTADARKPAATEPPLARGGSVTKGCSPRYG